MVVREEEPESFAAWLEEDRLLGFDLTGVPWRVVCFPSSRRWVWTFHHSLLDGRSVARILRSFLNRLKGEECGRLDRAEWLPATRGEREAAAAHYREIFTEPNQTTLDRFSNGNEKAVEIAGEGLSEALETAARNAGVTAATIVTWAWGQVMARAAGTDVVAVGQVRAGPPLESSAGFSMNTLPLAIRRLREGKMAPAWRELRERMLALRAFERVAPEELPSDVFGNGDVPWPGVVMVERGTMLHLLGEVAEELLESMTLHEQPSGGLVASAYLRPDLRLEVEGGLAGELAAHWVSILRAVAENPAGDAAEATLLPMAVRERLKAWEDGGPRLPVPLHLATGWSEAREKFSGETAVWMPGEEWTFGELSDRVEGLADSLVSAGVKAGDTVAVKLAKRCEWPVALLAIACIGGIYLPLGPGIPHARLRSMVEDGGPEVMVCDGDPDEDFGLRQVGIGEIGKAGRRGEEPAEKVMALLYTSGSTGAPKGVMLEHAGVLNEAAWTAEVLGLAPGERLLQFCSPGFDASLEEMLSCLLSGATLVPRPEEIAGDFPAFHTFVESAAITVLDLPTAFWAAWSGWMRETGERVPTRVRAAIIGGEQASARALEDWRTAGGKTLWNSYGPTEASIVATAQEIGNWKETEAPPIGRPLPGYRVRVADGHGESVPPGATGELWIGGPGVGPGYWKREDLTDGSFLAMEGVRWYRTGDLARWDDEGRLHFLGRKDDQLKIRGHRIEPGETSRLLDQFPGVAASHVGAAGPAEQPVLAAWVRWEGEPPEAWRKTLHDHLLRHLPVAAVPVRWAAVKSFSLTERGKLDRNGLPEPQAWSESAHEDPATPMERSIAAIWEELLGIGRVGRGDSFFDLGGHSLAALRLFARIAADFGVKLPMAALLRAPTLAGLADVVEKSATGGSASVPEVASLLGPEGKAPLFCIHGGDGGIFFYRNLAEHLSQEVPLVAIEAPALAGDERVRTVPVEAAAREYLSAVRKHQPQGPYRLAGYSFGGVLAYEMALQLRKAGEQVLFLGLFDTENPASQWRKYGMGERLAVHWNAMKGRNRAAKASFLIRRVCIGFATNLEGRFHRMAIRCNLRASPHSKLRAAMVREAHAAAMDAYRPGRIDVPVTLFKTEAEDDKFEVASDYGWGLLADGLDIVQVPGEHLTMFSTPHVETLAREVGKKL